MRPKNSFAENFPNINPPTQAKSMQKNPSSLPSCQATMNVKADNIRPTAVRMKIKFPVLLLGERAFKVVRILIPIDVESGSIPIEQKAPPKKPTPSTKFVGSLQKIWLFYKISENLYN